jgi:photosystem I reaction center subunit XII|tara:strand:- start:1891 stop:2031 length:141 start_codon:yes stop_codon:yes gene_type:complete
MHYNIIFKRKSYKKLEMITDSQIFLALMVALLAAILAIGLGRQLYV